MEWAEETIVRLRALWDEGHSTAEIGRRLGVSKNAVVGKAHRLDLPARRRSGKRPATSLETSPDCRPDAPTAHQYRSDHRVRADHGSERCALGAEAAGTTTGTCAAACAATLWACGSLLLADRRTGHKEFLFLRRPIGARETVLH
jgi:hypothetical protein